MRVRSILHSLIWVLLLMGWGGRAAAEDLLPPLRGYLIRQWTSQQGLPGNSVVSLTRSASGRIWVVTLGGLAWTDGAAIHPIPLVGPKAGFWSITEGPEGTLWLGGQDGRVWAYREGQFREHTPPGGLGTNTIVALDGQGDLWAGGTQGLWRRKQGTWARLPDAPLNQAEILVLLASRSGGMWAGTRSKGLWRVGEDTAARQLTLADGSSPEEIASLAETATGGLWVATNELGILRVEGGHLVPGLRPAPKLGIPTIRLEPNGTLWAATDHGLYRWDGQQFESIQEPVPQSGVRFRGLLVDPEGSVWLGSRAGGLLQLRSSPFDLYVPNGTAQGGVNAVADGPSGLWVASARGGLLRLEPPRGLVAHPEMSRQLPPDTYFKDLCQDGNGTLWTATNRGLYRVREGSAPRRIPIPGQAEDVYVRVVYLARDGTLWFGTQHGLHALREGRWRAYTQADGLSHLYILSIQEDLEGRLLVGTNGGGLCVLEGDRFRVLKAAQGLPSDIVFRIHIDGAGTWWMGTSLGLCRLKRGHFQTLRQTPGTPEEAVYQVLETPTGHLWLCTPSGLKRLEKAALETCLDGQGPIPPIQMFDQEDGVPPGGATPLGHSLVDHEGNLAIATVGGLLRMDPSRLKPNPNPPGVEIWGLSVSGQVVALDRAEHLPSRTDLEIHYSAFSLLVPSRVQFRYLLEGLDPVWREAGNRREAFYTRLPPGRYRFRVQACNNDQVWNEVGASLSLTVVPRWYETWLFRGLTLLFAIGLGMGASSWRTRSLRNQAAKLEEEVSSRTLELRTAHSALATANRDLELRVKERTLELEEALDQARSADRAKSAFLARMSHELRTPVNHMLLFTRLLKDEWTEATGQPPPKDFLTIETAGRGLEAKISDLMDFSDLEAGRLNPEAVLFDLDPILEELHDRFSRQADQQGLGFRVSRREGAPTQWVGDRLHLTRVLAELLTNALKFTASGDIALTLGGAPGVLRFEVDDSGPGIPPEHHSKVFQPLEQGEGGLARSHEGTGLGLAIAKRLVERMGGHLGFEARSRGGTRFWLEFRPD